MDQHGTGGGVWWYARLSCRRSRRCCWLIHQCILRCLIGCTWPLSRHCCVPAVRNRRWHLLPPSTSQCWPLPMSNFDSLFYWPMGNWLHSTALLLQPFFILQDNRVSWHPHFWTRGFCWNIILPSTCLCWWQLAYSDYREYASVLVSGVTYLSAYFDIIFIFCT